MPIGATRDVILWCVGGRGNGRVGEVDVRIVDGDLRGAAGLA